MAKGNRSRGTRASLRRGRATVARRGHGGPHLSRRGGGNLTFGRHGPSVKKDNTYEALRRKGYSKEKAARIANAQHNGTINHRRGPHQKR
ncbi:hypothetical protein Jolie1_071 [Mycobacterium phage Julie1]|uniref:Uncharacterized protein n=1 Tax=Mycobacterium phage Julie1 TaxID=1463812 RepID=W8ECS2_9CAUD|nr:hypothetical protein CG90_gp71 [Mycobacterium phage Julie1]YP_009032295.1 hypothetical protein FH38_gp69 [Mycobacterium phage Hosp]AHJ88571.1 hypothetical protein Jolie1_071 [Mycobacterium phage Julie1]AHK12023.1 hypothetical protein Hosp_069 [Mycobacterium phage Hosp]